MLFLSGIAPAIVSAAVVADESDLPSNRHPVTQVDFKLMPMHQGAFVNCGLFEIWLWERIEGKRKWASINRERKKAKKYFYRAQESS